MPPHNVVVVSLCLAAVVGCGSPLKTATVQQSSQALTSAADGAFAQIPVVLGRALSSRDVSKDAPTSEQLQNAFAVAEDVRDANGAVLVRQGTPVVAEIERRRHRRIGRQGHVSIRFLRTRSADGRALALDGSSHRYEGKRRLGGAVAGTVVATPLFLLLRGGDVVVPSGARFVASAVQ